MSDYTLKPVTVSDADIVEVASLLRTVFPDAEHFTDEAVCWQYRDNPDGRVVGYNAWLDAVLAAHYVTIPLVARVHGVEERGLLSLNTATHPVHQGKGLFTKLANATYAHAKEQGFGFVVGVANASSTHGFIKKLGFQLVSPLRAMAGVGPLKRADGGALQYERVWHREALKWRLAHPLYDYSVKHADGLDLLMSERTQMGGRLLLAAMDHGTMHGVELPEFKGFAPFRIWVGLDPAFRWGLRPYVNIPVKLRPSPLNLIFKDLTGQGRSLDPARTRFQAIDFDTL